MTESGADQRVWGAAPEMGALIRGARRQRGMTQRDLATAVSVNHTYICKIERGQIELPPSEELVRRIADTLSIDAMALLAASGRVVEVPIANWLAPWPAIQGFARAQAAWERVYESAASSPEAVRDTGCRLDAARNDVRALLDMEPES